VLITGLSVLVFGCGEDSGGSTADNDVFVARSMDDGITWTVPAALNTDANTDLGNDGGPQLATDGLGNWVAVWDSNAFEDPFRTDFDILVAHSTDDGASWAGHAELNTNASSDTGGDGWPQLTTDGQGTWIAVWRSFDSLGDTIGTDRDILVARSRDDGVTWTAPIALNTNAASDSGDDHRPQVTTDGQQTWLATWHSLDSLGGTIGTDRDILVARSTDDGVTWTAPAALNTNAGGDTENDAWPQVTTDEQGTWIAVWRSWNSLGGTIGTDYDILVARSTDDGVTWTAPTALNTNATSDAGLDSRPQLTTDQQGTWVAVWHSSDSLAGTIGTDFDILVARSMDDGVTWTAPIALNTNAAGGSADDDLPQVTTDGRGTWIAVWRSFDALGDTIGTDADVLFARSTDDGANWTAAAALNTNAANDAEDESQPQLTTDGTGVWVAVWEYEDPN
jgi:hypothetical protein